MNESAFNPVDTVAAALTDKPIKTSDTTGRAFKIPPHPVVKPDTNSGKFPPPNSPYWKDHPLETEHKDGTVRKCGEDIVPQNGNLFPKQMMPPITPSEKSKGNSSTYYPSKDEMKGKSVNEIKSNIYH